MVSMIMEYDSRCAACSSYATPCCRVWARRPGFLATGISKDSGRWAQSSLGRQNVQCRPQCAAVYEISETSTQ
jgi:hypothetical protein